MKFITPRIEEMVKEAQDTFVGVDILVNNAGIQHVAPIDEFPPGKWDAIIAINLSSAFHAIRTILPGMKAKKWGRIINIASAHGLVASPFKSAYVAAKHGMIGRWVQSMWLFLPPTLQCKGQFGLKKYGRALNARMYFRYLPLPERLVSYHGAIIFAV